ncbi:hypothetical protein DY703_14620 [Salmonella enterica]|uniref:hypothetical protein n=1 Tax=Salmonella enterica TaxID=28901 RepID=UPI0012D51376|nr:hypothetical protein [Salmonella enterica]EBQ9005162.1 hypothetical protein [Salmonella enterica subsp. enterica serovar Blockley]ECD6162190.1 hypothetical protein [Salmonella enterica subsp. enterica]ECU7995338.1 hypothetical protein [Salmonella enterica subsp. enterica serovar Toucra]EAW3045230.1 hypothetical protein [Salmonella enterica]
MSDVKRYKVIWNAHKDKPALTVDINHELCSRNDLFHLASLYGDATDLVEMMGGDVTTAALKVLGGACLFEQIGMTLDVDDLAEFLNMYPNIPRINSGHGITIIDCNTPHISYDDMEVEEVS